MEWIKFKSWPEVIHYAETHEYIGYHPPMDFSPTNVAVKMVYKNGKIKVHSFDLKFTIDSGHLDRMRKPALTIDNITDDQIQALRAEAGEHGDLAMVEICDIALSPPGMYPYKANGGGHCNPLHARGRCAKAIADAQSAEDCLDAAPGAVVRIESTRKQCGS